MGSAAKKLSRDQLFGYRTARLGVPTVRGAWAEHAGELAGAWAEFGGIGAILTNSAHLLELSGAHFMVTASRFECAQGAAWARLARERGNLQLIEDELSEVNRGRLVQCVNDPSPKFTDRAKSEGSATGRSSRSRNQPQDRPGGSRFPSSYQRAPKRRAFARGRSPF